MTQRIVCAALRAADGDILLGIRHYSKDMRDTIKKRIDGKKFHHCHDENQGFVDQYGKYLTRREAYKVAEAAGQIINPKACGGVSPDKILYSEGIY